MKAKSTRMISLASACVLATGSSMAATITIATYGGDWGDAMQECFLKPFSKATGNQAIPEPGVSGVTLAKLKQQAGNPSIDVAWLDGGVSELADDSGVLAPLDPAAIPNLGKVAAQGLYREPKGDIFAVSTGFYALGLVYNTHELKTPPTSWKDLSNPAYAGVVTVPSPANAMGIPFLLAFNTLYGGTPADVTPGIQHILQMKAYGYFDTAGNATNSFQSGEATLGANYASSAWSMADKGLPIAYVVPKEGALGGDIRLHLVKGGKNLAVARAFINFALAPKQAACMSNRMYVGPATMGVALSDRARQRMPWGPTGSIKNLMIIDWRVVNDRRSAINDQWNKSVAH